ncbi:uncharacterized protein LOC110727456 [Chenopodium quinoa]|uniref:uncharacterized protein LOC110727456 n=1 Tax=Chenopodium quinoa TaxID=63459 RepID=UPI000B78EF7B|nr:uncharacterized protein LOC110727456 [Chenopodium quinoa]
MVVNETGNSIEIEDKWGQRIQLKIWDNVFPYYSRQKDLLVDSTKPFGIVVTSTMVKYFNGKINLNTSTITKIYIDLQISEVDELKSLWSEKLDNATIGKLEIQHINIGPKKSTLKKYRLELSVIDHSGSTIFVVFDEEAKKLIGQDAITPFEAHTYEKINDHNDDDNNNENGDTQIPNMIANIIGSELVFKVKIPAYNHTAIRQTFTVMRNFDKSVIENKDVIKDNEDTSKDEVTVIEKTAKRPLNNIDSTEKDHDSSEQIASKR